MVNGAQLSRIIKHMANPQGTSFIPKRPTKGKIKTGGVRRIYVLSYLSYVFFFGTIIAAVGVFAYQLHLEATLEGHKQQLAQERDKFNQSDIERIRELNTRLQLASERMGAHVSLVSILQALESSVVNSIQFITFGYSRPFNTSPELSLSAHAENFDAVLFQREVLAQNPILSNIEFSEISLQRGGAEAQEGTTPTVSAPIISFKVLTELDPQLISYDPTRVINRQQDTQADTSQEGGESSQAQDAQNQDEGVESLPEAPEEIVPTNDQTQ